MRGIILAGGEGTRLLPMTKVTNKHLLPVYDQPMIMYPLRTLMQAGIKDIMIVSGRGHAGHFLELLGSGRDYGIRLQYAVQERAGGIAEALSLAEDFASGENIAVILGDNIYGDHQTLEGFCEGARVYLKQVPDPQRFGVAELRTMGTTRSIASIVEKPSRPLTDLAVTGLYLYDRTVFERVKTLKPSGRGELEITDVNNSYLADGLLDYRMVVGDWTDAGTVESLYRASSVVRNNHAI